MRYLAENISKPIIAILSSCYILLAMVLLPFPLNYALAPLPLYVAFAFNLRNEEREIRLGFCHDRAREIPQEQTDRALDWIEKQRKKNRYLP